MPIPFSCYQCGRNLRVKDELAGVQIFCPDCKSVLTVPRADQAIQSRRDDAMDVVPAVSSKEDPYAGRLDDSSKPPPAPTPEEEWDDIPPPRKLPSRRVGGNVGAIFGGLGMIALSIIIAIGGWAVGFLSIKLIVVLFIFGVITLFKGLFSHE